MSHRPNMQITGNQAAALIAYKLNEVCAIYPITPASEMSELVEAWSSEEKENIFGSVPQVFEMQSEAGVAGALHGALQAGSLATTFTASQGLLLMIPNMYKMAGELTPHVIHVATRSVATHALSVFGDHSDIMAARQTGYAMLGASSVQETLDFALISHLSSFHSRIPFVHFFDGFRTSHESNTISDIPDKVINSLLDFDCIRSHRERALNPEKPVLRGSTQGPDVFFQSREAVNTHYEDTPAIVDNVMKQFEEATGRSYSLFEYAGHPEAERVIVAMGSATETIAKTVEHLNSQDERVGVIKVKLFRPFSMRHLIDALPESCKSIAVLDRTKEPGSNGEPLYLDIVSSIMEANRKGLLKIVPTVVGGRYGLASKEFTPAMVKAVFENLRSVHPENDFTVGIKDDVTRKSLVVNNKFKLPKIGSEVLLYETRGNAQAARLNSLLELAAAFNSSRIQSYTEITYDKSINHTVSHLRMASSPINAPYLIEEADIMGCEADLFYSEEQILSRIALGGRLIITSNQPLSNFLEQLKTSQLEFIINRDVQVYLLNTGRVENADLLTAHGISVLHACILSFHQHKEIATKFSAIREQLEYVNLRDLNLFTNETVVKKDPFDQTLLGMLVSGKGNDLPVSSLPKDGTFDTGTSVYNLQEGTGELPKWNPELCLQCGACSMACGQGALRAKVFTDDELLEAPQTFESVSFYEANWDLNLLNFTIQVNTKQCTSCNICVDACPTDALKLIPVERGHTSNTENWDFFETIPELDRTMIDPERMYQQQFLEPLFIYPRAVKGCGEAPYLKLLSQLFGDRMLVANATGASSIFGGALPTTPWSKDSDGRGPAWSNSLFEDNAEFGLGFRLSIDQQQQQAIGLLKKLTGFVDFDLIYEIVNATQETESQIQQQRERVTRLKLVLGELDDPRAGQLRDIADSLVKKSIWIVGGDGWANDIGYGGLDHVLASDRNVNILVLDNELYDNTGGQMSKSTPWGASAKFAASGKRRLKKDLGMIAMTYSNVYVGSVAIGSDPEQALRVFNEAESYNGPSIILAYCYSESHGIDMKHPLKYQRAAVDSGQWLLYRFDPRRVAKGLRPLVMDSVPPSLKIADYMQMEGRFKRVFESGEGDLNSLLPEIQKQIDDRYCSYLSMANGNSTDVNY